MYVVRPVERSDIPALETMTSLPTPGVHTLPRTRTAIERAVERSIASFAAQPAKPVDESYFFVLEAPDKSVAGMAAIGATAGANGAFLAFRRDIVNQVSRDLNISHNVLALTLCSDLTDYSQLSGFYLRDRRDAGVEAALLSRARLMYAASAPQRFSEKFFAAMSGISDAQGRAPFWESLGRKFFQMDFLEAERMIEGSRNRTLIVELMPHYPVYVPLLPEDAQAAMGRVHPAAELAFRILSEEGFETDDYVDIFDGGPILKATKKALRSFSHAMVRAAAVAGRGDHVLRDVHQDTCLVATARDEHFRAVIAQCPSPELSDDVTLPAEAMRRLDITAGDAVLCVKL